MITHLPNAKLRVVDHIVRHGEVGLVLGRVDRFNLADDAALRLEDLPVLHWHVREDCHHEGERRFRPPEPLRQAGHALHVVTVPGEEGDVGILRRISQLGNSYRGHRCCCNREEEGVGFCSEMRIF